MNPESQRNADPRNASSPTSVRPYPHDSLTQRSTSGQGPVTAEGKFRVSRNALTTGLFSASDFVLPDERDIYTEFCAAYQADLSPVGALEQTLSAEILHAAWRLRRCSTLETSGENAQASIDRARAGAHRIYIRSINELRKLQTERQLRGNSDNTLGLASSKAITQGAEAAAKAAEATEAAGLRERVAVMRRKALEYQEEYNAARSAKQSQSDPAEDAPIPRGAPCSCGSGIKYKRCCGKDAPPVLGRAA